MVEFDLNQFNFFMSGLCCGIVLKGGRIVEWTKDADDAVKKVPFFVRKKVRARVEEQARTAGRKVVSLTEVKTAQARFLEKMSEEVRGYQIDTCFAAGGCRNRAIQSDRLLERIEKWLARANLLSFLKERVQGELKYHHEFRITLADCPNACSQPQIKDIGIIGAVQPEIADLACTRCDACIEACPDDCISFDPQIDQPLLDFEKCVACGKCVQACPSGTIGPKRTGYRVQLGGKLGRHPHLARELPGIYQEDEVLEIVQYCINFFKAHSTRGERFAELFKSSDLDALVKELFRNQTGTQTGGI
jgi:dissimilatory sulfite reductase (desulfoviridin) alpha/beta subunit